MGLTLQKLGNLGLLPIGILILLVFSFQYPFSVSVPIGGDAPSHIMLASSFSHFQSSPYPLSSFILSLSRLLPITWPYRFMIFMALGYATSGILLTILLRKIANNLTAAIGVIFWSVSTWDILPFFRDGTIAQLWSIPFLLLLFYAALSNKKALFMIMLVCTYLAHPATFAIVALTLTLITPYYFLRKIHSYRYLPIAAVFVVACAIITIFFFFPRHLPYASTKEFVQYISIKDFLETRVGILFIIAPLGLVTFYASEKYRSFGKVFLVVFAVLSFFATFNSLIGIGAWERRFSPYFVLSLIIFGSLGLNSILKTTFQTNLLRNTVVVFLMLILSSHAWLSAQGYYNIFIGERSSLHKTELTSYEWINANLPKEAVIIQTLNRGRGVEWLPIFAKHENFVLDYQTTKFRLLNSCQEVLEDIPKLKVHKYYFLFYTWIEKAPKSYSNNPSMFPLVYKNAEVEIYQMPEYAQISSNSINQCQ